MLKFVLPNKYNRDDVISFYDQIAHSGGVCIGFQNYKDYDGWLVGMQNRHTGKKLPISYSTRKKTLLSNDIGSSCRIGWIEQIIKREIDLWRNILLWMKNGRNCILRQKK